MPKRRREYSCVFNNWAIFFNPLCPASLPFGFRRKVPNGNARSSTTINRFSTGMFSFCNQYRTALPLRFIKVFGFSTIKSQFFTRMRAIAPLLSEIASYALYQMVDNPETYIMTGSPIFGTDITKSCYQIFHYPRIYKRKGKNIL